MTSALDKSDPFPMSPGKAMVEKKKEPPPLKHPRYEQPEHGAGFKYDKDGNLGYTPPPPK